MRLRCFFVCFATFAYYHRGGGGPLPNQKTLKQRASLDRITAFFFLLWFQKPARAQTNSNCMQQKTTKKHKNDTKIVPKGNQPVRGGGTPWKNVFVYELACFPKTTFGMFCRRLPLHLGSLAGPVGEPFGFFSSLGGSWDVEMAVLAGFPFWHHFPVRILLRNGRLWESQNLIIRCKGCQNHVFCYVRFFVVLGTILEVILELKKHSKVHCDSLLAPPVDILPLRWNAGKNKAKKNRFFSELLAGEGHYRRTAAEEWPVRREQGSLLKQPPEGRWQK